MEDLLEQLETNRDAEQAMHERIYNVETGAYWNNWVSKDKKTAEIIRLNAVLNRVLGYRFRILENIQLETQKQMMKISSQQRELNLKQVA